MSILKHSLEEVTPADEKILQEYFHGYDYQGAGYTFLANYIWRDSYCLSWERISDYLVLAGTDCMTGTPKSIIAMPLTRDGSYEPEKVRKVILETRRRFEEQGAAFRIVQIPGHMVPVLEEAFPEGFVLERDRDYDEYVYEREKLTYLSGRALHKKKNHLNYFYKNYRYETRPLQREDLKEVLDLSDEILAARSYTEDEEQSLTIEKAAIWEMMEHLGDPDVYSVGIYIKGKLEAFAIGERLNKDTAVEHFEKANDHIRGLYQAVCSEFCKILPEDIVYVNREEDMGLENLRQAKEALRPHHMVEKYNACFFGESSV